MTVINGYKIKPGADLRGADLRGAHLQGAKLQGADLSYANLYGANLLDADMQGAYFVGADLSCANMQDADLRGADVYTATLHNADLYGADLYKADFHSADLRDANLRNANLRCANFSGAYLHGANLRNANLDRAILLGAKNIPELAAAQTCILPEGDIVGWKRCDNDAIVKLLIPADARRSNATGRKCRAEFAVVLEVFGENVGTSWRFGSLEYRKGERVECHRWGDNRWQDCDGGIHFYITRAEAEAH